MHYSPVLGSVLNCVSEGYLKIISFVQSYSMYTFVCLLFKTVFYYLASSGQLGVGSQGR